MTFFCGYVSIHHEINNQLFDRRKKNNMYVKRECLWDTKDAKKETHRNGAFIAKLKFILFLVLILKRLLY